MSHRPRSTTPLPSKTSIGMVAALILLALTLADSASAAGTCIHDDVQRRIKVQRQAPQPHQAEASALGPIRIVPSLNTAHDLSIFCTAAGESKPTLLNAGSNTTCTADGILTDASHHIVLFQSMLRIASDSIDFTDFASNGRSAISLRAVAALTSDLASLFHVSSSWVRIHQLTIGSLRVNYSVVVPAGDAVSAGAEQLTSVQTELASRATTITPNELPTFVSVVTNVTNSTADITTTSSVVKSDVVHELNALVGRSDGSSHQPNVGAIVGSSVGVAAFVVLALTACYVYHRGKKGAGPTVAK